MVSKAPMIAVAAAAEGDVATFDTGMAQVVVTSIKEPRPNRAASRAQRSLFSRSPGNSTMAAALRGKPPASAPPTMRAAMPPPVAPGGSAAVGGRVQSTALGEGQALVWPSA